MINIWGNKCIWPDLSSTQGIHVLKHYMVHHEYAQFCVFMYWLIINFKRSSSNKKKHISVQLTDSVVLCFLNKIGMFYNVSV